MAASVLELEDGSGHLLLEDGTALLLEDSSGGAGAGGGNIDGLALFLGLLLAAARDFPDRPF